MLKVLEYEDKKTESIEFNTYIPMYVEFGSWDISKEPTVYWRTGDFEKSLIEIEIGKNKGDIRSITLNQCEKIDMIEIPEIKNKKTFEGFPVVNLLNLLNETYVDEISNLKVSIYQDIVYILFSEHEITSVLQNDNVGFGLDNDNIICSIIVKGLE
jgi:hypothetical protein